jgi:5-methylcytosine-specific restriction endonuclease McrA
MDRYRGRGQGGREINTVFKSHYTICEMTTRDVRDVRLPPKPPHFDTAPPGTCRWCGEVIIPKCRSRWHKKCVYPYKLIFWPSVTRNAVFRRDIGKCNVCGKVEKGWHMDHIIPLVESTGDISYWQMGNLQTLCKGCHKNKTSEEATNRAILRHAINDLEPCVV